MEFKDIGTPKNNTCQNKVNISNLSTSLCKSSQFTDRLQFIIKRKEIFLKNSLNTNNTLMQIRINNFKNISRDNNTISNSSQGKMFHSTSLVKVFYLNNKIQISYKIQDKEFLFLQAILVLHKIQDTKIKTDKTFKSQLYKHLLINISSQTNDLRKIFSNERSIFN